MSITGFESSQRAAKHPIRADRPSPGFFEGALLGNGGMGVVVCTRPDAVVLHFGHNAVWDVRLSENHREKIGTFKEVFEKVKAIPATYRSLSEDAWYRQYHAMTEENYSKPYPRPFPCGSVVLGFDRREAELLGHRLDIANGVCEVFFLIGNKRPVLQLFTDMTRDRLWLRMVRRGKPDGSTLQPHPSAD